ncbi:MAG: type II secretion system F family protein, partial [Phycisphaerae bacterium]
MPQYEFSFGGHDRRIVKSMMTADSARDARDKLRARGIFPESVVEIRPKLRENQLTWLRRPGRNAALVTSAVRDLATLMSTGIGLVDCLETVATQNRGRFGEALHRMRERVAGGGSLSEAMQDQPEYYDDLIVQMVRVGETAGTLDSVLDRLADFKDRSLQFKDRITTALVYPAIIILLSAIVSIFLMTVVLPMLLENLVASGRPLPWPTRVLKAMSDIATQEGWWIGGLCGVGMVAIMAVFRTRSGKRAWDRLMFSLPLLGPLARKQEIAHSAIVISTLMENGIVFVDAIQTASRA